MIKKIDKTIVEKHLRRFPIDRLRVLRIFTRPDRFISTQTIAFEAVWIKNLNFRVLGGIVSSLVRTKIEDIPLILPVGKSGRKAILELNEDLVSKKELNDILNKIGI